MVVLPLSMFHQKPKTIFFLTNSIIVISDNYLIRFLLPAH